MNTSAFLTTLFTMTTAATVAAVAVMILRLPLKKAPRWITCALWLAVLVRMVCPVGFSAPVSVTGQVTQRIPAPQAYEQVQTVTDPVVEPTPADPTPQTTQVVTPDPVPETSTLSAETVLFAVWAIGAVAMAGWALISYLRLRYRVADAVLVQGKVYETDRVASPFLCGFLRPRIYLPVGVSDHDRHYVLLHEEAHLRRRDHLTKPLAWLALCIHWFNPVLWLAYWLYGRDVETACDQAVVSDFDRSDTAGYAAALLHLGRKTALPHAVPLAFGEENAKGRVKHVLNYKRPGFWVAGVAVVVCVAAGVFLLADTQRASAAETTQIEDINTEYGYTWVQGYGMDLPDTLTQQLVGLLNRHGHQEYVDADDPEAYTPPQHAISLRDIQAPIAAVFYFDPETMTLVREDHNGPGFPVNIQSAPMNESLAQDPAYTAWLETYQDFLRYGRADAIYAAKTDSLRDTAAVTAVLKATSMEYIGPCFPLEPHIDQAGNSISIPLNGWPAFQVDQQEMQGYLEAMGAMVLAAVDDAQRITFTYAADGNPFSATVQADPANKGLTQEEFRALYDRVWGRDLILPHKVYAPTQVLYADPDVLMPPIDNAVVGSFLMTSRVFEANLSNPVFSAHPNSHYYENVQYQTGNAPTPVTDPDGNVLLNPGLYRSAEMVQVLDEDAKATGYTLYRLDDQTWVAYETAPGRLGYLAKVDLRQQ